MTSVRASAITILITFAAAFAALLIHAGYCGHWDEALVWGTLIAGTVAAGAVLWQGDLIKRQIAFSTYIELDREWNSGDMLNARSHVHVPATDEWDHSHLEAILEFFEKLAMLFDVTAAKPFVFESTLVWYAVRYFLFAREHGQIQKLRDTWQTPVYGDLERLYARYVRNRAGRGQAKRRDWEEKVLSTERKFWEQERKP